MDINASIRIIAETGKVRDKLLHWTRIIVPLCFVIEIIVFVYYKEINYFQNTTEYLIRRVYIPTSINCFILALFTLINISSMSTTRKNRASALCFILLISSVSINHAFYMPLWIAPIMALYSAIPFCDRKLEKGLFVICILNVLASGAYLLWEYPGSLSVYLQDIFIAIVLDSVMYGVMRTLTSYSRNMVRRLSSLMSKELETERKLHYDFLTGVYSREFIFREFQEYMNSSSAESPVGIAIIDIDDFKSINDTYGHVNGDVVLKAVGDILKRHEGNNIHAGRFGGEEFVIISRGVGLESFKEELEHIRTEISLQTFPFAERKVTISGGMSFCTSYITCSSALKDADEKLYNSKRTGKNRFTF